MKIFKDEKLKDEVIGDFDLGIVDVGKSQEYEYYLVNDTVNDLVDFTVSTISSEVEVLQAPSQINAHEVGRLKIKWTPNITIKKGLKTSLVFNASEIIKP